LIKGTEKKKQEIRFLGDYCRHACKSLKKAMRKVCRTNFVAGKGFIFTKPMPTSENLSREMGAKRAEALQIISREKGLVQKERTKTSTKS
jgi:hypothetical protein